MWAWSEKITSRELGNIGEFVNSNLLIDFKLFEDKIQDLITFNDGGLPPNLTGIAELNSEQLEIIEDSLSFN